MVILGKKIHIYYGSIRFRSQFISILLYKASEWNFHVIIIWLSFSAPHRPLLDVRLLHPSPCLPLSSDPRPVDPCVSSDVIAPTHLWPAHAFHQYSRPPAQNHLTYWFEITLPLHSLHWHSVECPYNGCIKYYNLSLSIQWIISWCNELLVSQKSV